MMLSAVQEIYHDKFSYTTKPKAEWYTKTGVVYFLYSTKHHCIRNLSHTQSPHTFPITTGRINSEIHFGLFHK